MKTKVYSSWNRSYEGSEPNKVTYEEELWVQINENAICVGGSQIGEVVKIEKLRQKDLNYSSPYSENRIEADKGKEVKILTIKNKKEDEEEEVVVNNRKSYGKKIGDLDCLKELFNR